MNVVNYLDRVRNGYSDTQCYDFALERLQALKLEPASPEDDDRTIKPISCKFCKTRGNEDFLAIANEDGQVLIENTLHGRKPHASFNAHNNAIFDMEWSDCHDRILLGSGDQTASVWDVRESTVTKVMQVSAHKQSVRTVTFRPMDKDVFATGSRDGQVILWDVRCSSADIVCFKPENIISFQGPLTGHLPTSSKRKCRFQSTSSICSLLFQNSFNLFSCSIMENCVDVWDMRKNYSFLKRVPQPSYKLQHPVKSDDLYRNNYYTSMCLSSSGTRLYANSKDGSIHCFNVVSYTPEPVSTYSGHVVSSTYIKCCLSPDDKYLVSGSSDGKGYLWNTATPGPPILTLNAHNTELSCVDWCKSGEIKIATCSDENDDTGMLMNDKSNNNLLMIWKVMPGDDHCKEGPENGSMGTINWKGTAQPKKILPTRYLACKPINQKSHKIDELNSPTVNLPNHVMDGTSPVHRCSPSSRKEKENRNWLSSLKKKTPSSLNAKSLQIKKSSHGHKPKACGNLLKFFKTANKECSLDKFDLPDVSTFSGSSMMSGVMEI